MPWFYFNLIIFPTGSNYYDNLVKNNNYCYQWGYINGYTTVFCHLHLN